jgi:large subunit ribosomal protein L4
MKFTVFSPDGTTSREQDFAGLPTFEGDKGLQAVKEVIVAIRQQPPGHAFDQDPRRGPRRRQEAVAPEGHRPRPRRLESARPSGREAAACFGPKPRDYSKKINAKVKALAFSRALFDRASAGEIAVIENFAVSPAKTKVVNQVVGRIAPKGKILLVDAPFAAETRRPRATSSASRSRRPPSSTRSISPSTARSSSARRRSRRSSPASTEAKN